MIWVQVVAKNVHHGSCHVWFRSREEACPETPKSCSDLSIANDPAKELSTELASMGAHSNAVNGSIRDNLGQAPKSSWLQSCRFMMRACSPGRIISFIRVQTTLDRAALEIQALEFNLNANLS